MNIFEKRFVKILNLPNQQFIAIRFSLHSCTLTVNLGYQLVIVITVVSAQNSFKSQAVTVVKMQGTQKQRQDIIYCLCLFLQKKVRLFEDKKIYLFTFIYCFLSNTSSNINKLFALTLTLKNPQCTTYSVLCTMHKRESSSIVVDSVESFTECWLKFVVMILVITFLNFIIYFFGLVCLSLRLSL